MKFNSGQYGHSPRRRWLLEDGVAYLNHAGYGAAPVRFMEEELFPALHGVLDRLADFVGADAEDIAFVDNATAGMNAVLQSMTLKPGDEVVATSHAYEAIAKCLEAVCCRDRAVLKIVDLPFPVANGEEIVAAIAAALGAKTRFLVVDHVTSPSAIRMPL